LAKVKSDGNEKIIKDVGEGKLTKRRAKRIKDPGGGCKAESRAVTGKNKHDKTKKKTGEGWRKKDKTRNRVGEELKKKKKLKLKKKNGVRGV